MDLNEIRMQIDDIDTQLLRLFLERMDLSKNVAAYKKKNNMPIFQGDREQQILDRISSLSPKEYRSGAQLLFTNIMDIGKSLQSAQLHDCSLPEFQVADDDSITGIKVACQGVSGANSEVACDRMFSEPSISFYESFEDVFEAVQKGEVEYGMLPIQNSTAGSVMQTFDLMSRYNFYIHRTISIKIDYCLAVNKGTAFDDITNIYSHEQALKQCSNFLNENDGIMAIPYSNTAAAAKLVSGSNMPYAALCSEECANIYGLDIIKTDLQNSDDNYTRFICIKKNLSIVNGADIISVSLSIPNTPAALYRLLTKFAVGGLNLLRIESKPIASRNFDVIFYLDFAGSVNDESVAKLLVDLEDDLSFFKFLGNYNEMQEESL